MQEFYDLAFARHERAATKRRDFAECWATYISDQPWDFDVRNIDSCTLEILAVTREPAPIELALIFSEWLAALRGALDNALYALSGQNPPPAGRGHPVPDLLDAKGLQGASQAPQDAAAARRRGP